MRTRNFVKLLAEAENKQCRRVVSLMAHQHAKGY